jgi:NIMA (never in mitosis gene a)-related kinase
MEYADGGDLCNKITGHSKAHTHFPEKEIWQLFAQMCLGLDALHKLNICHRDLKSANMFIAKGQIKIGDLNVSKVVKSNMLFTRVGTPYYTSPEIWNDKPYNQKSDMWSLGCVLYEMCALKTPFMAANLRELSKKIIIGVYPKIPSIYSAEMTLIIRRLLQINPSLRFSCCMFVV